MSLLHYILLLLLLYVIELVYFRLANHFNIIDKPNSRSSHSAVTLRGGGIIFCVAGLLFFGISNFQYVYFAIGLFAISVISFLDDILTLNNKIRLSVHLMAVLLLFYQLDIYSLPWYWLVFAGIFVIGTINAYNFMDGINGITGGYSLIALASLYYINNYVVDFTSNDLLILVGLSTLVFNFFNFRPKAKCFAGDVGSVSIAYIIVFLIGQLIIKTENITYILLLLVYGLDVVFTVFFRVIRKENIFEAHRSHFYQYLANQLKWSHLLVSLLYFFIQLLINCVLVFYVKGSISLMLALTLTLSVLFLVVRFLVEGKSRLVGKNNL
ncbi:glycosyltransferase family 4 protein [Pedobacter sp. KR3-3]|uniref:Glycosyltransferase family 4 protein n=1 Tax=Pedobacter albus TaxID=3113905 RepID=A0ABU7ICF1_9SPHI|nr:glycosyltransferase family 4 protein [Pedobacter sp. KR3-3]MEE1946854.1 glycosyltransferase family 4 protein [Pedobacter sp. KR3-3]